jgi:hypothetical protein
MKYIKRFFIWLLGLIGLQLKETTIETKTTNKFLFSSKFSNELMDDVSLAHAELNDVVTVSDHLMLRKDLTVDIEYGKKKYTAQILYSEEHSLELDEKTTLRGSLLVIYNENETFIQRVDCHPTRKLSYLKKICNNKDEFESMLDMDFYPIRGNVEAKKSNMSLAIHVYRWLS